MLDANTLITLPIFLTILGLLGVGLSFINLPGVLLVMLSISIYVFYHGFIEISVNSYIIFMVLGVLTLFIDNITTLIGAKTFGASKYGIIGAMVGAFLGLFFLPVISMIAGAFIGAVVGEFLFNRELKKAIKAGFGTFIGFLFGMIIKAVATIALFGWTLYIFWF